MEKSDIFGNALSSLMRSILDSSIEHLQRSIRRNSSRSPTHKHVRVKFQISPPLVQGITLMLLDLLITRKDSQRQINRKTMKNSLKESFQKSQMNEKNSLWWNG